jgi:hypothetical protein
MKSWAGGSIALYFHTLGTGWRFMVSYMFWLLYPSESASSPLWIESRLHPQVSPHAVKREKCQLLSGVETWSSSLLPCYCTVCSFMACHMIKSPNNNLHLIISYDGANVIMFGALTFQCCLSCRALCSCAIALLTYLYKRPH